MNKYMNTTNKPDLDNLQMHMPEGDLAIPAEEPQKITNAPILILLGVLLLGVLGALVWWYMNLPQPVETTPATRPTAEQNNEPESTTAEAQTENLGVMSNSDDLGTIEADLEGTSLDSLDTEINAIEAELNASS